MSSWAPHLLAPLVTMSMCWLTFQVAWNALRGR